MFDANGVPHLNDFGMATLLIDRETYETSTVADNLLWCPPEYRSHESTVPLKTTREGDVYSFGSITFTVSSLHYFSEAQRGHSKVDYIASSTVDTIREATLSLLHKEVRAMERSHDSR